MIRHTAPIVAQLAGVAALLLLANQTTAVAENAPGITDTEIKFGNIMPYSGPASALSATGKVLTAYFEMVNEKGGVNGRKLTMLSMDDGSRRRRRSRRPASWSRTMVSPSCSPPWAPRQARPPRNILTARKCRICS